jgi:hypothetical protein
MPGFEHCSTETRKIIKQENRPIFFLDEKGLMKQENFLGKRLMFVLVAH